MPPVQERRDAPAGDGAEDSDANRRDAAEAPPVAGVTQPPVALTTWYYALTGPADFAGVPLAPARALLARPMNAPAAGVPVEWRDPAGQLTLLAVGLVLQLGRPIYLERCSVARLALTRRSRPLPTPSRLADPVWHALAVRLVDDADIGAQQMLPIRGLVSHPPRGARGAPSMPRPRRLGATARHSTADLALLAAILAASAERSVMLDDVVQLLGSDSPEMFAQGRVLHLLAGRQPYVIWDLRTASILPPEHPLQLTPAVDLPATQGRRRLHSG